MAVIASLVGICSTTTAIAATATATTAPTPTWWTDYDGYFLRDGVPVYYEAPDSYWSCYVSDCNTGVHRQGDPPPIWYGQKNEKLVIICNINKMFKIEARGGYGWAPESGVYGVARVGCSGFD